MKNKILPLLVCLMLMLSVFSVGVTAQGIPETRQKPRLADSADLLTDEEEETLQWLLDAKSEEDQFDFVIHTTETLSGKAIETYADDYFDYNGFGYGESGDGLVLVVAMDEREYYISTCGIGILLFSEEAIDYCEEIFVGDLSSGDYYLAFSNFLEVASAIVENGFSYSDGDYNSSVAVPDFNYDYNYDEYYYDEFSIAEKIGAALIAGFIIALIITCIHAAKLKSVRSQRSAVNYVKEGSFRLTQSSDRFLYRNVTKRQKPKQSSGSGGVRTGSSGRSHGGGGGKF